MAGLPFLGLRNFANDLGVQPLRPRTIKMQVFLGNAIDARTVGDDRAKRRYPGISEAHQGLTADAPAAETIATHSNPPGARRRASRRRPCTLLGMRVRRQCRS
jgi:hypothetical protein